MILKTKNYKKEIIKDKLLFFISFVFFIYYIFNSYIKFIFNEKIYIIDLIFIITFLGYMILFKLNYIMDYINSYFYMYLDLEEAKIKTLLKIKNGKKR